MTEKSEDISIGKWNVPRQLFDRYVKYHIFADGYLTNAIPTPTRTEFERKRRWEMCVEICISIHREICDKLGLAYGYVDEFDKLFHREVEKQSKLKG